MSIVMASGTGHNFFERHVMIDGTVPLRTYLIDTRSQS
jgi:hypothetical protein